MNKNVKAAVVLVVAVALIAVGYMVLTKPDERTIGEKLDDAIGALDDGVDNAARELEDRNLAERLRDDFKDATDSK